MKQKTKVQTEEKKESRMIRPVTEETKVEVKKIEVPSGGDDFMEAIASISGPKIVSNGVKKDKMTTIVPSEALRIKVDEYVEAKKKEKEFKAAKENREADILEFVNEKYEGDGLGGNFQKSYRVQGVKEAVTYVSSDRFSSVKSDEIPVFKELLGEKFGEFIEQKTVVSIKEEVMSNPDLRKELISYVPKEMFGKFFKADVYYSTADGFDRKIFSLPKKTFDRIKAMVRQAKAALK